MEYLTELHLESRIKSTKSYLNQIKSKSYVPGIIYCENVNKVVKMKSHDINAVCKNPSGMSVIYKLTIQDGSSYFGILKDVVFDSLNESVKHFDFQIVLPDEYITVNCPIKLINQDISNVSKRGGMFDILHYHIQIKALAKFLPPFIEIDTSKLNIGDKIYANELHFKNKIKILKPNLLLVKTTGKRIIETETVVAKEEPKTTSIEKK